MAVAQRASDVVAVRCDFDHYCCMTDSNNGNASCADAARVGLPPWGCSCVVFYLAYSTHNVIIARCFVRSRTATGLQFVHTHTGILFSPLGCVCRVGRQSLEAVPAA